MSRLLTKREAADRLRVSVRTLDRLRSEGGVKATKVRGAVRFSEAEIQRYIDRHTGGR